MNLNNRHGFPLLASQRRAQESAIHNTPRLPDESSGTIAKTESVCTNNVSEILH